MESALMMMPRNMPAMLSASADLPLAVGPAIRMARGIVWRWWSRFMPQTSEAPAQETPHISRILKPSQTPTKPRSTREIAALTLIQPFRALRPAPARAAEVLAPPYDVLSSAEARERAKGKPWSFLHISKPEIDLDPAIDPYDGAVYAKAAENLDRMVAAKVLIRDAKPRYYVYRLTREGRRQTGLAAVAALADYDTNRIRKHELTTPVKEDDRVRQIDAINAPTGPVMVAYPDAPDVDALLARAAEGSPDVDVTADDGVRHQMWTIADDATVAALTRAVDALPCLYIADGHHRSAAASRVSTARRGDGSHRQFLTVLFPHHEMTILDYNRLLRDLNGHSPDALLAALRQRYTVTPTGEPARPGAAGETSMYLAGRWYRLTIRPELIPH